MSGDPAFEAAVAALTDVLETVPGVGDPLAAAEALCLAFDPRYRYWGFTHRGEQLRNLYLSIRVAEPAANPQG